MSNLCFSSISIDAYYSHITLYSIWTVEKDVYCSLKSIVTVEVPVLVDYAIKLENSYTLLDLKHVLFYHRYRGVRQCVKDSVIVLQNKLRTMTVVWIV